MGNSVIYKLNKLKILKIEKEENELEVLLLLKTDERIDQIRVLNTFTNRGLPIYFNLYEDF